MSVVTLSQKQTYSSSSVKQQSVKWLKVYGFDLIQLELDWKKQNEKL